jgi:pimeloyl-ACP methyl ester carboxylesterase
MISVNLHNRGFADSKQFLRTCVLLCVLGPDPLDHSLTADIMAYFTKLANSNHCWEALFMAEFIQGYSGADIMLADVLLKAQPTDSSDTSQMFRLEVHLFRARTLLKICVDTNRACESELSLVRYKLDIEVDTIKKLFSPIRWPKQILDVRFLEFGVLLVRCIAGQASADDIALVSSQSRSLSQDAQSAGYWGLIECLNVTAIIVADQKLPPGGTTFPGLPQSLLERLSISRAAISPQSEELISMKQHFRSEQALGLSGTSGISVLTQNAPGSVLDVVFVHGPFGHARRTWTHPSGAYWPQDFLPNDLPNVRVMTFGYAASPERYWDGHALSYVLKLMRELVAIRKDTKTTQNPLLFVAHSMGGLIVQEALRLSKEAHDQHRQVERCTQGLILMGVPIAGGTIASWNRLAFTFVAIFQMSTQSLLDLYWRSAHLEATQVNFYALLKKRLAASHEISIACFYEEVATEGRVIVVSENSARVPTYPHYGIAADHFNMVKFKSPEDRGYVQVLDEIRRCVRAVSKQKKTQGTNET